MGDALALAALFMFSCNAFVVRAATARLEQGLGFFVGLIANVVFAAVLVTAQALVQDVNPATGSAVLLFLLSGVLSSYLGRRGYFRSVQTMGPSRAAAVQVTNPVFALAFAWVLIGERLEPRDLAAMAVVVAGLVLTTHVPAAVPRGAGRPMARLPVAVVAPAIVAAVCYGLGNVARGAAVDQWHEPVVGGFLGALSGTAAYAAFHLPVRRTLHDIRAADRVGLALWSLSGAITITGQMAVIAATQYIPIAVAVAISSALPVLVIPMSVLLFGNTDRVIPRTVAGALLIVPGVVAMVLT